MIDLERLFVRYIMDKLGILEGLLFVVGDEGLTITQVEDILEINEEEAKELVLELKRSYESDKHGIQLGFLGDRFKLTTKKEHKEYYKKLVDNAETNTLSNQALETLVVVAYNEPVTVYKIEEIRGVGSRDMVRKLLAKGLLKEVGKSEGAFRATTYATTRDFLDYFGLSSKEELPKFEINKEELEDNISLYDSKYKESSDSNE